MPIECVFLLLLKSPRIRSKVRQTTLHDIHNKAILGCNANEAFIIQKTILKYWSLLIHAQRAQPAEETTFHAIEEPVCMFDLN